VAHRIVGPVDCGLVVGELGCPRLVQRIAQATGQIAASALKAAPLQQLAQLFDRVAAGSR
jgi:hypothetical protein